MALHPSPARGRSRGRTCGRLELWLRPAGAACSRLGGPSAHAAVCGCADRADRRDRPLPRPPDRAQPRRALAATARARRHDGGARGNRDRDCEPGRPPPRARAGTRFPAQAGGAGRPLRAHARRLLAGACPHSRRLLPRPRRRRSAPPEASAPETALEVARVEAPAAAPTPELVAPTGAAPEAQRAPEPAPTPTPAPEVSARPSRRPRRTPSPPGAGAGRTGAARRGARRRGGREQEPDVQRAPAEEPEPGRCRGTRRGGGCDLACRAGRDLARGSARPARARDHGAHRRRPPGRRALAFRSSLPPIPPKGLPGAPLEFAQRARQLLGAVEPVTPAAAQARRPCRPRPSRPRRRRPQSLRPSSARPMRPSTSRLLPAPAEPTQAASAQPGAEARRARCPAGPVDRHPPDGPRRADQAGGSHATSVRSRFLPDARDLPPTAPPERTFRRTNSPLEAQRAPESAAATPASGPRDADAVRA